MVRGIVIGKDSRRIKKKSTWQSKFSKHRSLTVTVTRAKTVRFSNNFHHLYVMRTLRSHYPVRRLSIFLAESNFN